METKEIIYEPACLIPKELSFPCIDCEHGEATTAKGRKVLCLLEKPRISCNGCLDYKDERAVFKSPIF